MYAIKEIEKDLEEITVPEGYKSPYLPGGSGLRFFASLEEEEKRYIVLIDRLIKGQEEAEEHAALAQTDEEAKKWKAELARLSSKSDALQELMWIEIADRLELREKADKNIFLLSDLNIYTDPNTPMVREDGAQIREVSLSAALGDSVMGALLSGLPVPWDSSCPDCENCGGEDSEEDE